MAARIEKAYPVTHFLLLLTIASFLWMQLTYGTASTSTLSVLHAGGMMGELVVLDYGQLWRLVTPIFIHIGWEHMILNGLSIYFVGKLLEGLIGSWQFLLLYLLSGIMGNAFVLYFTPTVVAAGASTSIFGMFAALVIIGYVGKNAYLRHIGRNYLVLILLNTVMSLLSPDVSVAGHIGGAVGGVLLAVMMHIPKLTDSFIKREKMVAALMYLALMTIFLWDVFKF